MFHSGNKNAKTKRTTATKVTTRLLSVRGRSKNRLALSKKLFIFVPRWPHPVPLPRKRREQEETKVNSLAPAWGRGVEAWQASTRAVEGEYLSTGLGSPHFPFTSKY